MIEVLAQMLIEEVGGKVTLKFHARHAGVYATKRELAAVNSIIDAMKATSALAVEIPMPTRGKQLTLTNGEKQVTKRRKRK
jgi:hypothetical protein